MVSLPLWVCLQSHVKVLARRCGHHFLRTYNLVSYQSPSLHPIYLLSYPEHTGKLADRPTHDYRWSVAEQTCTDFGANTLAPLNNVKTTQTESLWFSFSQLYRWVLRNEGPALTALSAIPNADKFVLWFTDITNFDLTRKLTQAAWNFAKGATAVADAVVDASLLLWYSPILLTEWQAETGGT